MQQLSYYTLAALTGELQPQLVGSSWLGAFTQQKDELVLHLAGATGPLYLRISCAPSLPYLVPQSEFARAKSNTVSLFTLLHGQRILGFKQVAGERVLLLQLSENYLLTLKLHGARSNVMLLQHGKVLELFKKRLAQDYAFQIPEPRRLIPPEELEQRAAPNLAAALRTAYPTLDKWLVAKILSLRNEGMSLAAAILEVEKEAFLPPFYVADGAEGPALWLLPQAGARGYPTASQALENFLLLVFHRQGYQQQRQAAQQQVLQQLKRLQGRQLSLTHSLNSLQAKRSLEELANLLMANLHQVLPFATSVLVQDFYTGGELLVELEPDLSPQQQAERWYRLHKEAQEQTALLTQQLQAVNLSLQRLQQARQELDLAADLKAMKAWQASYGAELASYHAKRQAEVVPFKEFNWQGFTIWVGKNAQNNDLLTFGAARKDDLWLHAKDVAGSHVVVRKQPGKPYPEPLIEYAAGLAAWFSKLRTNGLAAVSYTARKYVRKNKKLAPGQVIVEREQVVLVQPLRPPGEVNPAS